MTDFNLEELMDSNFGEDNIESIEELNENYLDKYDLVFFSDGSCLGNGKTDERNKAGFGIYILCNNSSLRYYSHNETKLIKKIDKDLLFYNKNSYKNIYYNLSHNNEKDTKCKHADCTYYAIYNNGKDIENGYCKSHKLENMELNSQYFSYNATNIRAEGYGILYSLIYIKLLNVDNITNKRDILKNFKIDKIDNVKDNLKYINHYAKSSTKFLIVTDSEFWINLITKWSNSWIKKNAVFDKKNSDLVLMINHYMKILNDNNVEINFKHVKGHSDKIKGAELNIYQKGNIISDKLANFGNKNKDLLLKII